MIQKVRKYGIAVFAIIGIVTSLHVATVMAGVRGDGDPEPTPAVEICPSGWEDVSSVTDHETVFACTKVVSGEKWVVIKTPDGFGFDHAFVLDKPGSGFYFDEYLVPEW